MVPAPSYTPDDDPLMIFLLITPYVSLSGPTSGPHGWSPSRLYTHNTLHPQLTTIRLLSPIGSQRHHMTTPAQARIASYMRHTHVFIPSVTSPPPPPPPPPPHPPANNTHSSSCMHHLTLVFPPFFLK